jgi:hypothetical protein
MFSKKSKIMFSDYTPAIDALLSVTILSIVTIAALSVPTPDSYMQDVEINIKTVQSRQMAVPLTIVHHPDMGVLYEIGKLGLTPAQIPTYKTTFENTVRTADQDFMRNTLDMSTEARSQYQIYLTMEGRRTPPTELGSGIGNYGITWINHPTCNPDEPISYITVKY